MKTEEQIRREIKELELSEKSLMQHVHSCIDLAAYAVTSARNQVRVAALYWVLDEVKEASA